GRCPGANTSPKRPGGRRWSGCKRRTRPDSSRRKPAGPCSRRTPPSSSCAAATTSSASSVRWRNKITRSFTRPRVSECKRVPPLPVFEDVMAKDTYHGPLERVDPCCWRIPKSYRAGMRVDGLIFANDKLLPSILKDQAPEQVANVAHLPGIQLASLAMP